MNLKKILIISLVLIGIFSTLSVASAGLFDFFDDESNSLTSPINATITDYDFQHTAVISKTVSELSAMGDVSYNGFITVDLGNASDEQLELIESNLNSDAKCNISTDNFGVYDSNYLPRIFYIDESDVNYDLHDKILNITFSYSQNDVFRIEDEGSFDLKVQSGNLIIPINDTTLNITLIT